MAIIFDEATYLCVMDPTPRASLPFLHCRITVRPSFSSLEPQAI